MGTWASLIELLFEPNQLHLRLLELPLIPPQNPVEQWNQFILPILAPLTSSATTLMASCLQFLFSSLLSPGYLKTLISLRYYHLKLTPQSPTLLIPIALMDFKISLLAAFLETHKNHCSKTFLSITYDHRHHHLRWFLLKLSLEEEYSKLFLKNTLLQMDLFITQKT